MIGLGLPWTPEEAMKRLAGVRAPWCVVGGWALDLWRGHEMRPHMDLEIAILRSDFRVFQAQLIGFKCYVAGSGEVSVLMPGSVPKPDKHWWVLLVHVGQSMEHAPTMVTAVNRFRLHWEQ